MTVLGREAKLFVNDIEVSKLLAVTGVDYSMEAGGYATVTITAMVDNLSMTDDGNIRIGKTKEETFKRAKLERGLII